jgi:uncharacterized protein (DUF58 family)
VTASLGPAPLRGAPAGPPLEKSKRRYRPRPIGAALIFLVVIVVPNWSGRTAGLVLVGVVLLGLLIGDGVLATRGVAEPDLTIVPLEDGDVNDEIRVLVSARHRGRPLVVSLPYAAGQVGFVLPAPGSGVLVLRLADPGWTLQQDVDVEAIGPFGLIGVARRVRVPVTPPLAVGPPVFGHAFTAPPIRPVFAGPSPGSPKGVELTRGVRPYLPGDSRRSVHWRMTAHAGSLMVREREGSGAVRIRVVIAMTRDGAASVVTAGRANAFVREFVGQGCEVELVTLESSGRALGPLTGAYTMPSREIGQPPHHTVSAMVADLAQLRKRLAMVVVGLPEVREARILTRVISDMGDQWV